MGSVVISGATSGAVTLAVPAVAGTNTITLPAATGTVDAFPSGTVMMFVQTSAPTGWTKSTANDNAALRIISGSVSTGGSVNFTTAFASQAVAGTVGSTTLTAAMLASHTHNRGTIYTGASANNPGTRIGSASATVFYTNGGSGYTADSGGTFAAGSGSSHNHSFTGTAINLAVKYVDAIIATKN
tara:strand:+ start:574 stop:1128 length:555 start_codon:yes stop_codon:yes gene_type:complete